MRLWHYKLIPALPNKMLVSQWRECIAIKRQWEKGTLKHSLVSYVTDYETALFYYYVIKVCEEMEKRKINFQRKYLDEIEIYCNHKWIDEEINYPEHNLRYFNQCFYNLQEKYDRGIITETEWKKIQEKYYEIYGEE